MLVERVNRTFRGMSSPSSKFMDKSRSQNLLAFGLSVGLIGVHERTMFGPIILPSSRISFVVR